MAKGKYTVQLSDHALKDFKAIQRYTLKIHGEKQVLRYAQLIKSGIENIAKNPELYGHIRPDLPEKYRSYPVGEHNLIYRVEEQKIFIVAILHGKMDFVKQLKSIL